MEYNPSTPHQGGTKAFRELTFKEQALSLNGTIAHLEKAVRYHARFGARRTSRTEREIVEKCVKQIERLASRLRK